MIHLSTSKERYEELKKIPLLFLHKDCRLDEEHHRSDYFWSPLDKTCEGTIPESDLPNCTCSNDYTLVVVRNLELDKKTSVVDFFVRPINCVEIDDWICIINSYIIRSQNNDDHYPFIFLLWFLDHCNWSKDMLVQALRAYSVESRLFVIKKIERISKCLSLLKQRKIKVAFEDLGVDYSLYRPSFIEDALSHFVSKENNFSSKNLFEIVDYVCGKYNSSKFVDNNQILETTSNPLIDLCNWLDSDKYKFPYHILPNLYCLVDIKTQYRIVKRYFYDISLKHTSFDISLFEKFRDNPFDEFMRYRYCLNTPNEPINIGCLLLVDCIITFYHTKGEALQSFDGILDLIIRKCDVTMPTVNLDMESFIPKCNGGAVYNPSFYGFINYEIVSLVSTKN